MVGSSLYIVTYTNPHCHHQPHSVLKYYPKEQKKKLGTYKLTKESNRDGGERRSHGRDRGCRIGGVSPMWGGANRSCGGG